MHILYCADFLLVISGIGNQSLQMGHFLMVFSNNDSLFLPLLSFQMYLWVHRSSSNKDQSLLLRAIGGIYKFPLSIHVHVQFLRSFHHKLRNNFIKDWCCQHEFQVPYRCLMFIPRMVFMVNCLFSTMAQLPDILIPMHDSLSGFQYKYQACHSR